MTIKTLKTSVYILLIIQLNACAMLETEETRNVVDYSYGKKQCFRTFDVRIERLGTDISNLQEVELMVLF